MTEPRISTPERAPAEDLKVSSYTYDDAVRLAWFWGEDLPETKARIERKISWGDQEVLDEMLHEATGQYNWIVKGPFSLADAEALAEYWSCTPEEAKVAGGHKMAGWLMLTQALAEAPRDVDVTTYVVAKGDTLTAIARRFSTAETALTARDVAAANADTVSDPDLIFPGQVLRIPSQPWGE